MKTVITIAWLVTLSACSAYNAQSSDPGKLNDFDTRGSFIGTQGSNADHWW